MKSVRPGQLVCYNAAGQRKKSLGLVIEVRKEPAESYLGFARDERECALIQWCLIGEYLPRRSPPQGEGGYWNDIRIGELAWHNIRDNIEVVDG